MNKLDSLYPVSEAENYKKLAAFEAAFFPVPASFRVILVSYNLAKPRRTDFPGRPSFHLNYLFGFSDLATENFPDVVRAYGGRMAEPLFPIGSIDGGDLLCMDKETGAIYYWQHEVDDRGLEGNETQARKVAEDLADFLERLVPATEPTAQEIAWAIKDAVVTTTPQGVAIRNAQRQKKGLRPLTIDEWHAKLNGIYDPDRI